MIDLKEYPDLISFDYNLVLRDKGDSVNCHSSFEKNDYGPIISGVYFMRREITGTIPYRVKARFIMNENNNFGGDDIKRLCQKEFDKFNSNFIINSDNTVRLFGVYRISDSQKISFNKYMTKTRFYGNEIVKEMYVHQDVFKNNYVYYDFSWISGKDFTEIKELIKEDKSKIKLY